MSPSNAALMSSPNTAGSTLRPRARRLISGLSGDEDDATDLRPGSDLARRPSPVPAPFDTRPVSPIPAAHPQRSSSGSTAQARFGAASGSGRHTTGKSRRPDGDQQTLAGLWGNSWTALQGIASDLLGSDLATSNNGSAEPPRTRRPLSLLDRQRSSSKTSWGVSRDSSKSRSGGIGGGTREEQTAAFRAQKRRDLLTRQDSSYADTLGKYKRRLSDERASASAPPPEAEDGDREALVYVHHVSKADTLAGITIRYNINANALRKANRMWPNDPVQSRQTLILPVDACAVKGKPVSGPAEDVDLLLAYENESLSTLKAEEVPPPGSTTTTTDTHEVTRNRANSNSTTTASAIEVAPSWTHDSWVLLPGQQQPTEIVRLPRRALAYFPPARRKSQSYSDIDGGTPSTSLDITRVASSETAAASLSTSASTSTTNAGRGRKLSNSTNGYFPAYLSGPGGVGTMSKNVHFPGPAQDGLNKMFAKHLPNVAPPKNQNALYLPELPLYTDDPTGSTASTAVATPAYPNGGGSSSTAGAGINFENVGGAIESWVRKLATKATAQFPPPNGSHSGSGGSGGLGANYITSGNHHTMNHPRLSVGAPGKGAGGIGDLIEMTNDFEIGGDEEEEERERGRLTATQHRVANSNKGYFDISSSSSASHTTGTTVRVRAAGKGGKGD